jgi:hypothetical protein
MDVSKILAELKSERQQIDEAIRKVELLARAGAPRRGRPPAWLAEAASKRRGRPPGSTNTVPAQPAAAAETSGMA